LADKPLVTVKYGITNRYSLRISKVVITLPHELLKELGKEAQGGRDRRDIGGGGH
jgi:hypothetical protein